MRRLLAIAQREIRVGFRNPWAYSFMALFTVFSLALLLIQSQKFVQGYTSTTGTLLNLTLYLLPLMALLLGSFSLTAEKEEGSRELLRTYPLSGWTFVAGKWIGNLAVLLCIVAFGFGISGVVGYLFGSVYSGFTFTLFFSFSAGLVLLFLGIAFVIGAAANNRWQALTAGVSVWFFLIIGWPTLLVSVLGFVPYGWIKPLLAALTLLNPAELVRLFVIVKMGGGAVLGPEYYQWVKWAQQPSGTALFLAVCFGWTLIYLGVATWLWQRGKTRD